MFYISKYISNTWHKEHANEVPCIETLFQCCFQRTTLIIIWFRFNVESLSLILCWITIDESCNLNLTIPQRWNTMHVYWLTCFAANFDTVYSRLALCQNLFKCCAFFLSPSLFFLMFCFRELLTHNNYSFTPQSILFLFLIP